jgi:hypothetical protein
MRKIVEETVKTALNDYGLNIEFSIREINGEISICDPLSLYEITIEGKTFTVHFQHGDQGNETGWNWSELNKFIESRRWRAGDWLMDTHEDEIVAFAKRLKLGTAHLSDWVGEAAENGVILEEDDLEYYIDQIIEKVEEKNRFNEISELG